MSGGFFKVYRRLQNSDLWLGEPFTRGQAWVDLIGLARHTPGNIRKRGIKIFVDRGVVPISEKELSVRWKWSRGKVRRYLDELSSKNTSKTGQQNEQQIEQQKNNITTLIRIINYEIYQGSDTADSTAKRTPNGHQTDTKRDSSIYNRKKDKNGKKDNIYPPNPPEGGNGSALKIYPYPDWLNINLWADFHRMRSRIRKPITTERTITGLINKLREQIDAGFNQDDVIQAAIDNCWLTFYPLKGGKADDKEWIA